MPDNINEILSPEAEKQLQELQEGLFAATEQIVKFGKAAKGITIDFKGVKDFQSLADVQTKVKETTEKMTGAAKFYNDTIQATDKIIAQHNGHSKEFVQVLKGVEDASLKAARAEDVRARTAARSAAQIAKEQERERKATAKLNNEYEQLKIRYKAAADEAKRLGAALGTNDAQFKTAAADAHKMHVQLLNIEKSVGQAQRQVGQYNTAAFAMSQILRETPAFAYSTATGILAISNNIPILVDEIQKLRAANAALKAEGAATIPIWKTLMGAVTSPAGLITIATAAITLLAAKTDIFKSKTEEATKVTDDFNKSLQQIADKGYADLGKEIDKIDALIAGMGNLNASYSERLQSFRDLVALYPELLSHMDAEAALQGKSDANLKALKEAARWKADIAVLEASIYKEQERQQELMKEIEADPRPSYAGKSDAELEYDRLQKSIESTKETIQNNRELLRLAQRDAKEHVGRILEDIDAEIRLQNAIRDTTDATDERHKKAIEQLKVLQKERAAYLGQEKDDEEKRKGTILKGDEELLKARYDLEKQRVEQDRDNQKDITDNVKEELQKRLDAHMKYQTDLIQLADMQAQLEIDIEDVKINKLIEKRKKATSSAERKDIDKQIMAAFARQRAAQEDYNQKVNKITLDGRKDVINIIKSSNEEWLKVQSDSFEARKQAEIEQYITEGYLLRHALETGELTRREYEKRIKDLKRKQHISSLQAEVEYDRQLLKNKQLTAEQRIAIEKKLNKDQEALFNAGNGGRIKSKKGRITDSVASLLGGSDFLKADLDEQERYLQSFYDATVNLARTAAQQIIEINNQKYQAELSALDRRQEQIRAAYKFELDAIDVTYKTQEDKENAVAQLRGQMAAQEASYEQQRRTIAQQQARFQRTASIAAAISNTAVGITKALAELGPLAAVVIPLIAASGAAQIATIASAPIPQYAKGTDNHKGGLFWAGDGGEPEYVKAPNKPGYWTPPTSTLYNEKAGTSVTPLSKMVRNVNITGNYTPGAINEVAPHDIMYEHLADLIGEKFDRTGQILSEYIKHYGYKPQKQPDMKGAIKELRNTQGL